MLKKYRAIFTGKDWSRHNAWQEAIPIITLRFKYQIDLGDTSMYPNLETGTIR
jgi:hypothetical protein